MHTVESSSALKRDVIDEFLQAKPNQWISGHELSAVGGSGWRGRLSELRSRRGRCILSRFKNDKGERVTEYRLLMPGQVQSCPLADLGGEQVRLSLNPSRVEQYAADMRRGDSFPAIVVFRDHDGALYVADGFHRRAAALACGHDTIPARVEYGTADDAIWYALKANRDHGLPLNEHDKKHAITLALQRFPTRSTTQIAEQVGCSQRYVVIVKGEVSSSSNLPARVIGKDGKSYPAKQDKSRQAVAHRIEKIRQLAATGLTGEQLEAATGLSESTVRAICKRHQIVIHADKVMRNSRRIDSNRVIEKTVESAVMLTAETKFIDWKEVDVSRVPEWAKSLRVARIALTRFINLLEEQLR